MDNMIELSDIINDLKDRIDEIAEKLESLEDERADKQQLQMLIYSYMITSVLVYLLWEQNIG